MGILRPFLVRSQSNKISEVRSKYTVAGWLTQFGLTGKFFLSVIFRFSSIAMELIWKGILWKYSIQSSKIADWVCSWEIMADATSLTPPSPGLSATLFPNKILNPTVPCAICAPSLTLLLFGNPTLSLMEDITIVKAVQRFITKSKRFTETDCIILHHFVTLNNI